MSGKSPWSVKGIEPEAREAAKIAARRAGLTVGAWLNQTIRHAAAQELKSEPVDRSPVFEAAAPPPQPPGQQPLGQQPPGPQPPALTLETVLKSVQSLSARIQQSEDRAQEAIEPIASKVQDLTEQMADIKGTGSAAVAPIERALGRVAERLERIENEPRHGGRASADRGGIISRLIGRGG
ncbi:MAG: hypothetical protein ACTSRY_02640 [Alphaproteobacteria bacterium]